MASREETTRPITDWRRRRQAAGLSLEGLASLSGIATAYISQIETGRMVPTAAEAEAILRVLRDDRSPIEIEATTA